MPPPPPGYDPNAWGSGQWPNGPTANHGFKTLTVGVGQHTLKTMVTSDTGTINRLREASNSSNLQMQGNRAQVKSERPDQVNRSLIQTATLLVGNLLNLREGLLLRVRVVLGVKKSGKRYVIRME